MKFLSALILFLFSLFFLSTTWAAPKVVVTISPFYALTQAVMKNVAEPILLIEPGASPHHYALKPSQVSDLNSADLLIWVGESLETFLIKTISQLPKNTQVLTLLTTPQLNPLPFRTGRTWEHDHDHGDHNHTGWDPHVWLDPVRTQILVTAIAAKLASIDPQNKTLYETNAQKLTQQIAQLHQQLTQTLAPVKNKAFIVFHDAYQYLEQRYQLNAIGAITLNPEMMPSAQHINAIQQRIKQNNVVCIFSEPQFKPAIVAAIAKDTNIRQGTLNPEGTQGFGFEGYSHLLTTLSQSLIDCLEK